MSRHWIVIVLVVIMGLESSTIGYAASGGPHKEGSSGQSIPCPHRGDCCSHHSTHSVPPSCLAHCTGAVGLVPSSLMVSFAAARVSLDPYVAVFPAGEHAGRALRPPIV